MSQYLDKKTQFKNKFKFKDPIKNFKHLITNCQIVKDLRINLTYNYLYKLL